MLRSGKHVKPEDSILCGYVTHAHLHWNCKADAM